MNPVESAISRSLMDVSLLSTTFSWQEWIVFAICGTLVGLAIARKLWHRPIPGKKTNRIFDRVREVKRDRHQSRRIAYIMDVSESLTDTEMRKCRDDLSKSIFDLSHNDYYQIIFFSGPAWYAHQRIETINRGSQVLVKSRKEETLTWNRTSMNTYELDPTHALPTASWIPGNRINIGKSFTDIAAVEQSRGTTWHLPIMLSLNLDHLPDEIYFLTDGQITNADLVAAGIVETVKSLNANTKIHTRAIRDAKKAKEELEHIALRTKGEFAVVD